MRDWLVTGWHILVFRTGPQALPCQVSWTALAAAAYLLTGLMLLSLRGVEGAATGMLALDFTLLLAFILPLLGMLGVGNRIPQTLQAIWLCGAALHLVSLPFAPVVSDAAREPDIWLDLAVVASLAALFWSIGLLAHILRHALEWPLIRTLPLALAFTLINLLVNYHVFSLE